MIVKKTKQLGNFKRGVNLYIPKRRSAAPSGINPATPTNLIITFSDQVDGYYSRNVAGVHTAWYQFIDSGEECRLQWTGTIWRLRRILGDNDVGEATNDTGNVNLIPTTGWVYTITDYGSPTVTITAA